MLSNGLANLSMEKLEDLYSHSAGLVRTMGKTRLPSGKTLENALTIGDVDFWAVISPSLAVGPVATALAQIRKEPLMTKSSLFLRNFREKIFRAGFPLAASARGCHKWPQSPTILFLGFSHYMFRETLESVAKIISQNNELSPVILSDVLRLNRSPHGKNGLLSNSIWEHWDTDTANVASEYFKEFNDSVKYPIRNGFLRNAFRGGELDLYPTLQTKLLWIFDVFLPRMLIYSAVARHILEKHRPSLIVSPDVNDPRTRIYSLLGRNLKIPSLDVQLSFYIKKDVEWQFFIADHLAVTGEANKNLMEFHGIPPAQMSVTGSARYDNLTEVPPEVKMRERRELGIQDNKTMLVFASQPYVYGASSHSPEARIKMIKDLFDLMKDFDQCHLVVKPHPLENTQDLKQLAHRCKNITFIDKTSDIRDLIMIGDAFITFCSNSTFDALVRKKPTIVLSSVCSFFEESGAVLVAKSKDDISSHLYTIVNGITTELQVNLNTSRQKLIEEWLYKVDGLASERIAAVATKMARALPSNNKNTVAENR